MKGLIMKFDMNFLINFITSKLIMKILVFATLVTF